MNRAPRRTAALPFRAVGAKAERSTFLHLLVTNWISPYLGNKIRHGPRSSHAAPLHAFDAFALEPTRGLELAVGDTSGASELSEIAGRHWLELALAAIATQRTDFAPWVKTYGYELHGVASVAELVGHNAKPLVEVVHAGTPWLVAVASATAIISDAGGPPNVTALDAKGRAAVVRAARTKRCECQLCRALR